MNRPAAVLLLVLVVAVLLGCGSADGDPAQQRVEKPFTVETQR